MNIIESHNNYSNLFKNIFIFLGVMTFVGIIGYGASYIIKMPEISPDGFVPKSVSIDSMTKFGFGNILAVFVLLYAFNFFPIIVMYTAKNYKTNPYAMIIAFSLITISLIIEIINNLPLLVSPFFHVSIDNVSKDTLLYLRQKETITYLAFDVAGFILAYIGFFIYALILYKRNPLISYTIYTSIILFIANVPFLWIAPNMAIILMFLSIVAFALVPIFLVRLTLNSNNVDNN
jgi:hypothetical protein